MFFERNMFDLFHVRDLKDFISILLQNLSASIALWLVTMLTHQITPIVSNSLLHASSLIGDAPVHKANIKAAPFT